MAEIDRSCGQHAFGGDPANYDRARLAYPERVYDVLRERCGLRHPTHTFEIGPGTGKATRELLQRGALPLVAIEPDHRLADFLAHGLVDHTSAIDIRVSTFEDVVLPPAAFDLGVAATMFHWFDQSSALRKVAPLLRRGGWWAMWWNVYGDPARPDEFRKATRHLLASLDRSPSRGTAGKPPFALDVEARMASLTDADVFDTIEHEIIRWTAVLDTAQVRELYATFSPIGLLDPTERQSLLSELGRIVEECFGGRIERTMATPLYVARRR